MSRALKSASSLLRLGAEKTPWPRPTSLSRSQISHASSASSMAVARAACATMDDSGWGMASSSSFGLREVGTLSHRWGSRGAERNNMLHATGHGPRMLGTKTDNENTSYNGKNCRSRPSNSMVAGLATQSFMMPPSTDGNANFQRIYSYNNNLNQSMMLSNLRFYSQSPISHEDKKSLSNDSNPKEEVNASNEIITQSAAPGDASQETNKGAEAEAGDTFEKPPEQSIHNISYLPPSLHPYAHLARMDKPIGTFLLLHPCLWSTALATVPLGSTHPDLGLCALFGAGSFIMRGAGCTINDMWDSRFDRQVARTRSRPLASHALTYPQAWKFLALQLSAGLGVLLSLPHMEECFWWGVASLPLVATYPLMKRYTDYPQLALGLTFNWGAIMGWVAVRGEVDWSVIGPLYGGCVAWTLVYDTLYAHQDKDDDAKLGLKSTALTFGEEHTKPILTALTGAVWGGWMMAGYNCGFGNPFEVPYYYMGVTASASHLMWQIWSAELNHVDNLAYRFRSNNMVGWLMFGSCVTGNMMAPV